MIQRIQTLWLFLVIVAGVLTMKLSFYSGLQADNQFYMLTATSNISILIATLANIMFATVIIFLYKNRKQQLALSIIGVLLSIGNIILYFLQLKNFIKGSFDLWCIFVFAISVFYILAIIGIYKDERLIKKLDKLR